jgi:AraC-like DNA-binding protein
MQLLESQSRINGRGFTIARIAFDRAVEFPRHVHDAAQLVFVFEGRWFDRADQSYELKAGEILFHPPKTRHENRSHPDSNIVVADLSRAFLGALEFPGTLQYRFDAFDELPERLFEELQRKDPAAPLMIEALLLQLLASGARAIDASAARPEWLARVTSHIRTHAHQPLALSELAEVGSVSLSRLSHGFREHTGKTISAYIREYRLRIAARALRQTARPIKDIALNFGFYDHAHFSREFAKMHGVPPIEYRRRTRPLFTGGDVEAEEAKRGAGEAERREMDVMHAVDPLGVQFLGADLAQECEVRPHE